MARKSIIAIAGITTILAAGIAYANLINPRQGEITEFYMGHSHEGDVTVGGPQHSGGTDRYGCHNGSVPYHCH